MSSYESLRAAGTNIICLSPVPCLSCRDDLALIERASGSGETLHRYFYHASGSET
ncbi:hypothetical protein BV22DRAFT_1034859 [Leucogyrophana mollusca]|uniref:Uncharacterized protein n=1 Tax=Leucogyrophana mollusca TaxID=85980 RepID=A0ACB8BIS1_9AGAM|nr:hypothetical protein BV22DRAFT_1034859 [Leucogyrophana mollusca]